MAEPLPREIVEAADISAVSQLILRERLSRGPGYGLPIADDRAGIDRPDPVEVLNGEFSGRAGLTPPC